MFPFKGYVLDPYNIIVPCADKNKNIKYYKFTFSSPLNEKYEFMIEKNTTWTMEEIDCNNFYWKGKRFILKEGV